jgi:hypothetical protein
MKRSAGIDADEVARLQGLLEQTADRRERARLRGLLQFATPEARAAHGELTRQKMNSLSVRQRVQDGLARANAPQLVVLREAWRNAPAEIRKRFLTEIVSVVPTEDRRDAT